MSNRTRPDRYGDAVRARRAELRAARALLLGGHRAELRGALAAGRLAASAELAVLLAAFDRDLRRHVAAAAAAGRRALPALVADAVVRLAEHVAVRWGAAVLAPVRRVAGAHGLPLAEWSGIGELLARRPAVPVPGPDPPPGPLRALLAGATSGTWRLALLPAAALPAVGLPAVAGRAAVPLAAALGLALLVVALRAHRAAADRARLGRWAGEVVGAVRVALETELSRRLLDVERLAGAALDDAVARRRARVDEELRALAPDATTAGVR